MLKMIALTGNFVHAAKNGTMAVGLRNLLSQQVIGKIPC